MSHTTITTYPKIDIHSHIIYGIDDGSKDIEQSMEAIRQLSNNKVEKVVCTPHFDNIIDNPNFNENFKVIKDELKKNGIDAYLGFEFMLNYKNIILLKEQLFDNKYSYLKYLLVEIPRDENLTEDEIIRLIDEVMDMGYKVIFAHPEFYINHRDIKLIERLRENDIIIQCDASSFIKGKSDKKAYKFAYKLLDRGLINIIASDYHDNKVRNYDNLNLSFYHVASRCGINVARHLFYSNPKYIIENFINK